MLQLLSYSKETEIDIDKLRIWDFYLTFPHLISKINFPSEVKDLKKIFKEKTINPYEDIVIDSVQTFERMKSFQLSAIHNLVSYGFVNAKLLGKGKIQKTDKEIPLELLNKLSELTKQKENVIKLLTSDLINLPLLGEKGWKAKTGLLEFKYDPK